MKKFFSSCLATFGFMAAANAQIVISEISYNPPESGTDTLEFIEIYNAGASPVDLQGYYFRITGNLTCDSISGSLMLPAGGLLVTAVNDSAVYNQFGMTAYPRQWRAGRALGNNPAPASLRLFDAAGALVDSVAYDDFAPWDTLADGDGYSLILCDVAADNNLGTNWRASMRNTGNTIAGFALYGSPGILESCSSVTNPSVAFLGMDTTVLENAGTVTVRLGITNPNANATSVQVNLGSASTASSGDYTNFTPPVTITFPAGSSAVQTFTFDITDDAVSEGAETVIFQLAAPTNSATIAGSGMRTVTIDTSDGFIPSPVVTFLGMDTTVQEGVGMVHVHLGITYPNANATSVQVNLGAGTATSGTDFTGFTNPTTVTFPAGSSASQMIMLTITDDTNTESAETVILQLSNPTNGATIGGSATRTITIAANDAPVGVQETQTGAEAKIYPNPAKEMLFIESASLIQDVLVTNALGQTVAQLQNINNTLTTFSTSQLANGTYQVSIRTEQGMITKRFIIHN